jgi:tetratricopeptide (TPR) repeat protein
MKRLVLAALVMVAAPSVASAADHPAEADNALEIKGREAFAAGRYDDAIDAFAKLYAKSLNPTYLRNIGRAFQKKRDPQAAIDKFRDYLAQTKSGKYKISADERAEIEGYIKEMEALRDQQAKSAATPPPPPPVQPLQASPVVTAPPPPAALPPVDSANPPAATLTATAPPPEEEGRPLYKKWWFWTILGVVAVGGATAIVVAASSGTSKPACPPGVMCK